MESMVDLECRDTLLEAAGGIPGLVGAGTSVDRGVPLRETKTVCEARFTILAAERDWCASVTWGVSRFASMVWVVAWAWMRRHSRRLNTIEGAFLADDNVM